MTLNFVIEIFAHSLSVIVGFLLVNYVGYAVLLHKCRFLIKFLSQYKLNFLIIFFNHWLTTTQVRSFFKLEVVQFFLIIYEMYRNVEALLLRLLHEYMKLKTICVRLVGISFQFCKKNHHLFDALAINESSLSLCNYIPKQWRKRNVVVVAYLYDSRCCVTS